VQVNLAFGGVPNCAPPHTRVNPGYLHRNATDDGQVLWRLSATFYNTAETFGNSMARIVCGFYWRDELQASLGETGQSLYAGIDYGHVWRPSPAFLVGMQLAGAVIGVRGHLSAGPGAFGYDPLCRHADI